MMELNQACFRFVTSILRDYQQQEVTENQLKVLVSLVQANMLESEQQPTALALMKAIIQRKLETPDVYDLMDDVARLMIVSQIESARSTCAQVNRPFFKQAWYLLDLFLMMFRFFCCSLWSILLARSA
jgi:hypothetical protein